MTIDKGWWWCAVCMMVALSLIGSRMWADRIKGGGNILQPQTPRLIQKAGIKSGWFISFACVAAACAVIGSHRVNRPSKIDLCAAIRDRQPSRVQAAIDQGADPNRPINSYFGPPLLEAMAYGPPKTVRILLRAGAKVHVRGPGDITPVMGVSTADRVPEAEMREMLRMLMSRGESLEETDDAGCTALLLAMRVRNGNAVRALLSVGADVHTKNRAGQGIAYWERVTRRRSGPDALTATIKHAFAEAQTAGQ